MSSAGSPKSLLGRLHHQTKPSVVVLVTSDNRCVDLDPIFIAKSKDYAQKGGCSSWVELLKARKGRFL